MIRSPVFAVADFTPETWAAEGQNWANAAKSAGFDVMVLGSCLFDCDETFLEIQPGLFHKLAVFQSIAQIGKDYPDSYCLSTPVKFRFPFDIIPVKGITIWENYAIQTETLLFPITNIKDRLTATKDFAKITARFGELLNPLVIGGDALAWQIFTNFFEHLSDDHFIDPVDSSFETALNLFAAYFPDKIRKEHHQ